MNCPECNTNILFCGCSVAETLIELSGKQLSDGKSQQEADRIALRLYYQEKSLKREV